MDQERTGGDPGLRKFTDVTLWAQEDLRTKEEGKEKDWIKNGREGNPGLRKFTDVALCGRRRTCARKRLPRSQQPITKGRGSEEAEAAHGGRGAPGLGRPTMAISMRFTTPEPSNRFNRSATTGRDRWSLRAQCG